MADKKLLGDKIEQSLKKIRADKAAKLYTRVTGKDCGCKKRKKKINDAHSKLLRRRQQLVDRQKQT